MQSMTEDEARSIMKAYGWSYKERIRHKNRIPYVYGQRREGNKVVDRYICRLSRLRDLTEPELVAKLAPKPTEEGRCT